MAGKHPKWLHETRCYRHVHISLFAQRRAGSKDNATAVELGWCLLEYHCMMGVAMVSTKRRGQTITQD